MTLQEWIGAHGPLSADAAFLIALDICRRVGRSSPRQIRATIASLDVANIHRGDGGWAWHPADVGTAAFTDSAAIARVGALLLECLTGDRLRYPLAGEQQLRAQLRASRPDLTTAVVDIVVSAAATPDATTLARLALELRRAISNERTQRSRRPPAMVLAVCLVALLSIAWATLHRRDDSLERHGLTSTETASLDVLSEMAQSFALVDEHTAAAGLYNEIAAVWRRRIAPDDPRDAWNEMHLAWVKSLAGDRVTAEQLLLAKPPWLTGALGAHHPYTRAAALELAAAVFARGTSENAAALNEQAKRGTATLLAGAIDRSDLLAGVPAPPGTIAHAAPNGPVSEGFRVRADGSFAVPLTSMQRLHAERQGWRLHVIAEDGCRASVAIGDPARLLEVDVSRLESSRWQLRTRGLAPPQTIEFDGRRVLGVSLVAGSGHDVQLRVQGSRSVDTKIDESTAAPAPPFTLSFAGRTGAGDCTLVWLEIPIPFAPKS